MKKNYFLRQWAFALVLLLTITITFYSCKKDKHNDPDISGADLRAARSWVKLNLKTTENNPFKTLSPNWDDIYTTTEDNQAIIEVGLTNPDKIFVGDSPNDYSHPEMGLARSHIRLVLFKDLGNNSIVAGCYMVVVNNAVAASAKLHYKRAADLSGKIYYFNADGSFSNGALYSNGEIVKANGKINSLNQSLLNKKLYSTDIKKLNIGIKDKIIAVKSPCADGVDIPIWGQSCVGVEGYMTCTPYISGFAHLPGSCDGDYGDNGGYAGSHGGYAGGNNGGNPTVNKEIIDSLQGYPCAQALIKEMKTNICTDIATLIKTTFAKNDLVDVKFTSDNTLIGTTIDGRESRGGWSRLTGDFTVGLNPDVLKKATQEYILVTMYHEALHAFFDRQLQILGPEEFQRRYEGVNVSGGRLLGVVDDNHTPMAYQKYVKELKDVIMKFNTSFNEDRAWALAKAGIIQSLLAEKTINDQERDTTKSGFTGTKCP